jgi:hypothetical protein
MKSDNQGKMIFFVLISMFMILASSSVCFSDANTVDEDTKCTIYYRPAIRFGTDDRTLYINDFLVSLYRDQKNILFSNIKYTPNDQDGWEVNLGLGYRHYFPKANLILGVNGFYDQRKTPWGKIYEQWGVEWGR